MDKKSIKGYLVGYDGEERYRIWVKEEHRVCLSRDVIFQERLGQCDDHTKLSLQDRVAESDQEKLENKDESQEQRNSFQNSETESENEEEESQSSHYMHLRDRSKIEKPRKFDDYIMDTEAFIYGEDPQTYQEAIENPDKKNWKKAMDSEMTSLKENKTGS